MNAIVVVIVAEQSRVFSSIDLSGTYRIIQKASKAVTVTGAVLQLQLPSKSVTYCTVPGT